MDEFDLPRSSKFFINRSLCLCYKVIWSKSKKKLNSLSKIHSFFSSVAQSKLQLIKIVFGLVHPWRRENDSHIWTPLPLYSQQSNNSYSSPWDVFNWHSMSSWKWCFRIFLENFNNEINLLTYCSYLCWCTQ